MTLVLLKSNGKMLMKWLSEQFWICCSCMSSFSEMADAEVPVLQAYCLADVDEINPLGIEIWYRTTRRFSILDGIEAIWSVPKKYRTQYPALFGELENEPIFKNSGVFLLRGGLTC